MGRMAKMLDGFRILIAEDDYLIAAFLADYIAQRGGTVIGPVGSGKEVLQRIEREAVDCAVIDLKLQDGPCLRLIEALMERGVRIIVTTGYPVSSIPAKFRQLPIFAKPYDYDAVADRVTECCGQGKAA